MQTVLIGILLVGLTLLAGLFVLTLMVVAVHHRTGGAMVVPPRG